MGRTPWSARVPPDPLLDNAISIIKIRPADVGVGCGPGGPPYEACKLSSFGKLMANLPHTVRLCQNRSKRVLHGKSDIPRTARGPGRRVPRSGHAVRR